MLWLFNLIGTRVGVNAAWRLFAVGLPLLALAAGLAGGAWGAWQLGRAPLLVDLARLSESNAETQRIAQRAATERIQAAQMRSDTLALALIDNLTQTETLKQEKTHALRAAAAGRVCLSSRALGVLHTSPGLRVAGLDGVPPAQPEPAAPGGAPATHPHQAGPGQAPGTPGLVATDEDIGVWAIAAGAQFEACRARLNALIDWHTPSRP